MENSDSTSHLSWSVRLRLARRSAEHDVRNFLLLFMQFLCRSTFGPRVPVEGEVRGILIVRTGKALGDAVMSLCLIPALRRKFPRARVDLLLRDSVAPLFRGGSGADEVLELHPRFLLWPRATLQLMGILRRRRYDVVIACDNPYKSSFTTLYLRLWTGAPRRIGFQNEESRGFLTDSVASQKGEAMVTNLMRLGLPLGLEMSPAFPKLVPLDSEMHEVEKMRMNGERPVIIFAPNHWRKSWPLESFLSVASALTERNLRVWLILGPGDKRGHDDVVQAWLKKAGDLAFLMPPQPLPRFAAILACSRLFITNDGGPYHIGVAAGARCVGIFLSSDALRDFSYREEGRLVALQPSKGPEGVAQVLKAAAELLDVGK